MKNHQREKKEYKLKILKELKNNKNLEIDISSLWGVLCHKEKLNGLVLKKDMVL